MKQLLLRPNTSHHEYELAEGDTLVRNGKVYAAVRKSGCNGCEFIEDTCADVPCSQHIWVPLLDYITKRLKG